MKIHFHIGSQVGKIMDDNAIIFYNIKHIEQLEIIKELTTQSQLNIAGFNENEVNVYDNNKYSIQYNLTIHLAANELSDTFYEENSFCNLIDQNSYINWKKSIIEHFPIFEQFSAVEQKAKNDEVLYLKKEYQHLNSLSYQSPFSLTLNKQVNNLRKQLITLDQKINDQNSIDNLVTAMGRLSLN